MRRTLGALITGLVLATAGSAGVAHAEANTPVVFVHGYLGGAWNWITPQTTLRQAGYTDQELFQFNYDFRQSNEKSAAELGAFVEQVRARTGADKVDIVNHSMGGMVSRWYVKELGGQQVVDHWASIAGANHGTTWAFGCLAFESCREMAPGSAFLQRLNSGDETPGDVKYSTWYSPTDGIVIPHTSTAVEGARNTEVQGETHLGILEDEAVLQDVARTLATD
ncbi:triacylglycerol lipase [Saccharopolyspora taberi]|uniref:Triacylglycerol lipase n=1 Tax=Saccharopolyspora taberi TaxID=60895 RepID=A0ABN3VEI6_9PSEU